MGAFPCRAQGCLACCTGRALLFTLRASRQALQIVQSPALAVFAQTETALPLPHEAKGQAWDGEGPGRSSVPPATHVASTQSPWGAL